MSFRSTLFRVSINCANFQVNRPVSTRRIHSYYQIHIARAYESHYFFAVNVALAE